MRALEARGASAARALVEGGAGDAALDAWAKAAVARVAPQRAADEKPLVAAEARELIEARIEALSWGLHGHFDFAAVRAGGSIVRRDARARRRRRDAPRALSLSRSRKLRPRARALSSQVRHLTSAQYAASLPLTARFKHALDSTLVGKSQYGEQPEALLLQSESEHACWAFAGTSGRVTIRLAARVKPTEVRSALGEACARATRPSARALSRLKRSELTSPRPHSSPRPRARARASQR